MKKIYLIPVFILLVGTCFAKSEEKKERAMSYDQYLKEHSYNDTTAAIIAIYFDKRENTGVGQMSFLPITVTLSAIIPAIGIGLTVISTPIFINGFITYHKYSDKKLEETLSDYKENKTISKKLAKKITHQLKIEQLLEEEEMLELELASLKLIRNN
jgi:uncharacterized membrane protein YbaN (DUF454 family)